MSYQSGEQSEEKVLGLRDRKKVETRKRIAHATVDVLVNEGTENATIDRIAEKVNVSTRTFHNYFPHREAALLFILNQFIDEIVSMIKDAEPGQPLISVAENIAVHFYNRPAENPNSFDTLSRLADYLRGISAQHKEELFPRSERHFSTGIEFFSPLIQAFQQYSEREGGSLSTANALLLINTVMFVPGTFTELSKAGNTATEKDIRNAFRLLAGGLSQLG